MQIAYQSDLHLEFSANRVRVAKSKYRKAYGDVLIIAGDIDTLDSNLRYPDYTMRYIQEMGEKYQMVYIVPGNHEYWGRAWERDYLDFSFATKSFSEHLYPNVKLCNNVVEEFNGVRFALTTLWSQINLEVQAFLRSNDRYWIRQDGEQLTIAQYNKANTTSLNFLRQNPADIICTHYVPTYSLMHPAMQIENNNEMFYNNTLEEFIQKQPFRHWIFGHSHIVSKKALDSYSDKFVTNALGYVNQETSNFILGKQLSVAVD